jgi:hypothetical protein
LFCDEELALDVTGPILGESNLNIKEESETLSEK